MPIIEITDATFSKLQQLAIPLTDDIETLVNRLADAALCGTVYKMPSTGMEQSHFREHSITTSPRIANHHIVQDEVKDLTHTRLISAAFDGSQLDKASWNSLAKFAHETALKKLGTFEALQRATRARLRQGRYEQEGFTYLPNSHISMQGMDSNMAWSNCVRLAKEMGTSIYVQFEWRNHPKAVQPGQRGQLSFEV